MCQIHQLDYVCYRSDNLYALVNLWEKISIYIVIINYKIFYLYNNHLFNFYDINPKLIK